MAGHPHGDVRASGLPYGESETYLLVNKLRKDVRKGRGLVVHADAIRPETPISPTPDTTEAGNLPDSAISTDVGIIADLELANSFFANEAYHTPRLSDISEIAERAIMIKRTWPNATLAFCKRDIVAAFKMIRSRPEMCFLLRAEFNVFFRD